MNMYENLMNQIKIKEIKQKTIYEKLGCSRQNYFKHLNNLKNNNITFNGNQILIIKKITGLNII